MAVNEQGYGDKQPLLVYRMIANRYRPPAVMLILFGILGQLPRFVPDLPLSGIFNAELISVVGFVGIVLGCTLLAASLMEKGRGWVQCQPDYLMINAPTGRVAVAYQRINTLKPVSVMDVFPPKAQKGRNRSIIKPLVGKKALEVVLSEFPLPDKQMRKRLHHFMFSTRDIGFVLIVPQPRELGLEVNAAIDRMRHLENERTSGYVSPMDRSFTR